MDQTPRSMNEQEGARSLDDIERDISETRREIGRTIAQIQHRLSPDHIKNAAKGRIQTMAHDTSTTLIDRIKSNPAGLALTGIGLWMLFRNRDSGRGHVHQWHAYGEDQGDVICDACGAAYVGSARQGEQGGITSRAKERMQDVAGGARERVSGATSAVQDRVSGIGGSLRSAGSNVQERARRIGSMTSDRFEESPILLGAIGIAVGAAIGALIPETRREQELLGSAADRAIDRATSSVRERVDGAKEVVRSAGRAAVDRAREESRRQNLTSSEETAEPRERFDPGI